MNDADCASYLDALGSDVIIVHTLSTLGELSCPALLPQVTALAADITMGGCGRRWLGKTQSSGRPNPQRPDRRHQWDKHQQRHNQA